MIKIIIWGCRDNLTFNLLNKMVKICWKVNRWTRFNKWTNTWSDGGCAQIIKLSEFHGLAKREREYHVSEE